MFFVSLMNKVYRLNVNGIKENTMETQSKSGKVLENNEAELMKQQGSDTTDSQKHKESTGADYHNYVPKHSSHGRSNSRTFGPDHEPGTVK
jgi:hypothetical protein